MMPDLAELDLRIDSSQSLTADSRLKSLEQTARSVEGQVNKTGRATRAYNRRLQGTTRYARDAARQLRFLTGGFLALRAIDGTVRSLATFEKGLDAVAKTTSLTDEDLQRLSASVIELGATQNPTALNELLDIGRAAGQLGVEGVENIEKFTKTIGEVALASDLSADSAATGLRRIQNVLGGQTGDIDRLGSTLVQLGNNFAATESEILAVSQRVAQTGSVFNITQADALSLGAAFRSLGVRSELAGAQTGRMFRRIEEASIEGGTKLDNFVKIVGGTADEFRALADQNPTDALVAVIQGLSDINAQGGSTVRALQSINLASERSLQVFPALALGVDEVTRALDEGRSAWDSNNAATIEAQRGADNLIGDYGKLQNALRGLAISAGDQGLLPALRGTVQLFGDLARLALGLTPELERNARIFEALGFGIQAAVNVAQAFVALKLAGFLAGIGIAAGAALGPVAALTAVIAANPFGAAAIALGAFITAIQYLGDESEKSSRALDGLSAATRQLEASFSSVTAAQAELANARRLDDTDGQIAASQRVTEAYRRLQVQILELSATSETPFLSFETLGKLDKQFSDAVNVDDISKDLRSKFQQALANAAGGIAPPEGAINFDQIIDLGSAEEHLRTFDQLATELERLSRISPLDSDFSQGQFLDDTKALRDAIEGVRIVGVPTTTAIELLDKTIASSVKNTNDLANSHKDLAQATAASGRELFDGEFDLDLAATAEGRIAKLREEQTLREELAGLSRDEAQVVKAVAQARELAATAGHDETRTAALLREVEASERLIIETERLTKARADDAQDAKDATAELVEFVQGLEREHAAVGQSAREKELERTVQEGLTLAKKAGYAATDLLVQKITDEVNARHVLKDALAEEAKATKELEKAQKRLADNQAADTQLLDNLQLDIQLQKDSRLQAEQRLAISRLSADATAEQRKEVAGLVRELDGLERANSLMDDLGSSVSSATDRFASGTVKGSQALGELIRDLNRNFLNAAFVEPLVERFKKGLAGVGETATNIANSINPDSLTAKQIEETPVEKGATTAATTLTTAGTTVSASIVEGATAAAAILKTAGQDIGESLRETAAKTVASESGGDGDSLATEGAEAAADNLRRGAEDAGTGLAEDASDAAQNLRQGVLEASGSLGDSAAQAASILREGAAQAVTSSLAEDGASAAQSLGEGATQAADSLRQGISDTTQLAAQSVADVSGGLAGGLVNSAQSVAASAQTVTSAASSALTGVGTAMTTATTTVGTTLATSATTVASTIVGGGAAAGTALVTAATAAAAILAGGEALGGAVGAAGGAAGGGAGAAAGALATGGVSVGSRRGSVRALATGGVSAAANRVTRQVVESVRRVGTIPAFARGGTSAHTSRVSRGVVEHVQKTGRLPALANGGVRQGLVRQSTLMALPGGPAVVGEGMYAEAVLQAHNMGGNQMGVQATVTKPDGSGGQRTISTLATLQRGSNGVMGVKINAMANGGVSSQAPQAPLSGLERVLYESAAAQRVSAEPQDRVQSREAPNATLKSDRSVQPGSNSTHINNNRTVFNIRGDRDSTRFNRGQINRDVKRADRRPSY